MSGFEHLQTQLTREYGVRYPFACAGLAFAGGSPPLPIAVGKAGGIGSLGVGMLPAPVVEQYVEEIRAATPTPLNINFITIFTQESHIALCEKIKPEIVSFHWGHPSREWIDRLHAAGCKVWEQVGSVENAKLAVADGVDLIIAQGSESGGHNYGTMPTFVLVPAIVDAVAPVPVLAAGGIADGRGVAAALALGAVGVWVGTRMTATIEADVMSAYKDRMVASDGTETVLASLWGRQVGGFNPMRVIVNKIVGEWAHRENAVPADGDTQPVVGTMTMAGQPVELRRFSNFVPMASTVGDIEQLPMLCGQGVGLIHAIEPAGVVIERMMTEAAQVLQRLSPVQKVPTPV